MVKSSSRKLLLIPVFLGLFMGSLYLFSGWRDLELGIYDLFLKMKPEVPEDKGLLLLNVDDEAIMKSGSWPWPRGIMAQGLEVLTEFDASYAVFDIEYLEKSPESVDRTFLNTTLQTAFNQQFQEIKSNTQDLLSALAGGLVPLSALSSYAQDLSKLIDTTSKDLYQRTKQVAVENDTYLGKAIALFGKAFLTLNLQKNLVNTTPEDLRAMAQNRFSYPKISDPQKVVPQNQDYLVPIREVSSQAAGAGFTNVPIDNDGKRRRIQLLSRMGDNISLQLAFEPLMDYLGKPEIQVAPGVIRIKRAQLAGHSFDFDIPIDDQGMMMIHWPKKTFDGNFRHLSFYKLTDYRETEGELIQWLTALDSSEIWRLVPDKNPVPELLALWDQAETARAQALETPTGETRLAYQNAKKEFYQAFQGFLVAQTDTSLLTQLAQAKNQAKGTEKTNYETLEKDLSEIYKKVRELGGLLDARRQELSEALKSSVCFIGLTATASTDFGVTPFSEKFANVGTHAAVFNTVLQKQFLTWAPSWLSFFLSLLLPTLLIASIRRLGTGGQIAVGIGATGGVFLLGFLFFLLTGIFVGILSPILAVFLSFLTYTLAVFFLSEQEKSFLRKAFSTYLSGDVINQIVSDPSLLKLGGQKKWISAMFTDVKGFSTISEQMDPEALVRLLNIYLSGMSDIILDNRGTIDKFEGDAIISFFGAPVSYDTHAQAICRSAVAMKIKEKELNEYFLEQNLSPGPLLTRIGINTGDMVVGNMGTEKKMDYTIMGNAVNLAARLEGVNKQYGSWILASQSTHDAAGEGFLWRKLDRVRVVGINQPLRLYELLAETAHADAPQVQMVQEFEKALELFEARDYAGAERAFQDLVHRYPEDGPSKVYLKRSGDLKNKPPAEDWDGVFNLTEK